MSQSDNIVSEAKQDEILSSILQKLTPPPSSSPPQNNGSGDILSSLLSNPELISKLPTIISSIKPIIEMLGSVGAVGSVGSTPVTPSDFVEVSQNPDPPESLHSAAVKHNGKSDSRTALLCAMKPYLSRDRQNAIDYIVKIGRLGDILKTL